MFDVTQKFKADIEGRGSISLGPGDYVTSGGEGHVYRKDGMAIKLWDDAAKAAQRGMPKRIARLKSMSVPCAVFPEALVIVKGTVQGYVMPWVDGWGLPLAFTNSWRLANGFQDEQALSFLALMKNVVSAAHNDNVVLGDANEFNILGDGFSPLYIDVDSWVPEGFSGDKILPTIYDHHSKPFTKDADWFAWAVVGFQLLIGIHPYKGSHAKFVKTDLTGRMKANVSVFSPDVTCPRAAVRSFSLIPHDLRAWFEQVFEHSVRVVPPNFTCHPATVVTTVSVVIPQSGKIELIEMHVLASSVVCSVAPGILRLLNGELIYLYSGNVVNAFTVPESSFICLSNGALIALPKEENTAGYYTIAANVAVAYPLSIAIRSSWSVENILYAILPDGLLELLPREMKGVIRLLPGRRWALNANATLFFDGLAVYNALGAKFLIVPHDGGVSFTRCKELDNLTPLAAVRSGRVGVVVACDAEGAYYRLLLLFSDDYTRCTVTITDTPDASLVVVIIDSGVVAAILPNGQLELTQPLTSAIPIVDDMPAGMRLFSSPTGLYGVVDNQVFKLKLKDK